MGPLQPLNVNPPKGFKNTDFWRNAVRYQYVYSLAGLVLGVICVTGGITLFLHGIGGSSSWTAKFLGLSSKLSDAAPGTILFVVGLFIVAVTKFNVGKSK